MATAICSVFRSLRTFNLRGSPKRQKRSSEGASLESAEDPLTARGDAHMANHPCSAAPKRKHAEAQIAVRRGYC